MSAKRCFTLLGLVLLTASGASAQSTIYFEGFEAGLPAGWTVDAAVGPAPGVQWGVDGTPAAPFLFYG
jgi:hypothetical protein